jgi:hypothetical protein
MMTQPSPEVQQRLRALCAQMAVAQRLDDEVQRELYAHMEDKLLAYLNGEETMTEEDALILVREHFGDPIVVKGLLQAAHPIAAGSRFLRRVTAIVCTAVVCLFLSGLLVKAVLPYVPNITTDPVGALFMYMALPPLLNLPALYLLWVTLRFWQGQIDRGRPVWFMDYPAPLLAFLAVGVFLIGLAFGAGHVLAIPPAMPRFTVNPGNYALVLQLIYTVCSGLVWLWWCDRPPRLRASLLAACGFWAVFEFLLTVPSQAQLWWMASRGGTIPAALVDGAVHYFVNGLLILCAAGLCVMAVHAALRGTARRKAQTAGTPRP